MARYNGKKDRWELEWQRTVCAAWPDWCMWGLPDPAGVAVRGRKVKVGPDGSGEWFWIDYPNATIFCGTFAADRPPGDPAHTIATTYSRPAEFQGAAGLWKALEAARGVHGAGGPPREPLT